MSQIAEIVVPEDVQSSVYAALEGGGSKKSQDVKRRALEAFVLFIGDYFPFLQVVCSSEQREAGLGRQVIRVELVVVVVVVVVDVGQ